MMTTGMSAPPMEAVRCAPRTPESSAAEDRAATAVTGSSGGAERKAMPEASVAANSPRLMAFFPAVVTVYVQRGGLRGSITFQKEIFSFSRT